MREGWVETTLGEVLDAITERAGDISNYEVLSVTEKRGIIPQSEVFNHRIATDNISKYKVLRNGDIAFNPYLLWCGAVGQWKGEYPGVVSPVYECFRTRKTESPRYLGLIFESGFLTPYFDSTAIGSIERRRRTTLPVFYEATIPLPPVAEQKRIVDLVSSVDSYIDSLQSQVDTARTARSAVLHELLSAGGDDWTETTLGEVSEVIMGRQLSPSKKMGTRPRPYLRAANIGNWGISIDDVLEMDFTAEEEAHFACLKGDVLLVEGGNEKSVGCPALVSDRELGLCIQNTIIRCRIRDENQLRPDFLYHSLRHSFWNGKFGELCAGTTIMHLGQKRAVVFPIHIPPLDEQKRIVEIISSMDDVIHASEQAVLDAKNLRSGLLSDLLSGEHEIPSSYDNFMGDS